MKQLEKAADIREVCEGEKVACILRAGEEEIILFSDSFLRIQRHGRALVITNLDNAGRRDLWCQRVSIIFSLSWNPDETHELESDISNYIQMALLEGRETLENFPDYQVVSGRVRSARVWPCKPQFKKIFKPLKGASKRWTFAQVVRAIVCGQADDFQAEAPGACHSDSLSLARKIFEEPSGWSAYVQASGRLFVGGYRSNQYSLRIEL